MLRPPPRSTRTDTSFPTRRSSDLLIDQPKQSSPVRAVKQCVKVQREVLESNPYVLASDDSSRAYPGDDIRQRSTPGTPQTSGRWCARYQSRCAESCPTFEIGRAHV